jgi:PAS domain S-box-containing protein
VISVVVIWLERINRLKIIQTSHELDFQKRALDEHDIVSITDVKGAIIYANDKFCKTSGYPQAELLGKSHRLLKSGEHSAEFYADLWHTIANGQTWHGEIRNLKKDGGFYWVDATIVPFLNEKGKPFQYVAIRTDITEQKEKRIQAEAATLAKSEFLASMSHEIRTPMAGVIGMADLILDTNLSPQQLNWAMSIKSSGENLLTILNGILDQSKLEAGKLDISPIDFHLASFVEDTTQLFGPKIDQKGLLLNVVLDEALPEGAHADRLRISQILSNLLSNALKFTDTGAISVHVTHQPMDDDGFMLRIGVTDSGIGLSEVARRKLFSAFVQADSSTSRTFGGTGLGLSISKRLAELMGGEIGVESTKGLGSTYWFTVPCLAAKARVEAPAKQKSAHRWLSSRSLKVLVAEDNEVNQELFTVILEKLDHHVVIADNGEKALELLAANDFDIVLMDIRMPVMDGLEATAKIRAMTGTKSGIPIIALTADVSVGNIAEYTNIGIDEVCAKPLDLALLLKAINKLLGEDIHTSVSRSAPAGEFVDFTQLLQRVSTIVDRISSLNENGSSPAFQIDGVPADKLTEMSANYEINLAGKCQDLKSAFAALIKDPADDRLRSETKIITHTLKGGGAVFGYHLVTQVAAAADDLLEDDAPPDKADIASFANHVDALSLIADKRMSGDCGAAGRLLLQGLKDFA